MLTLICIIYRVLTDRWALLLMVLRIFVKTHKQTGAHSNTKKKKKTMIRLRTFGCRNCVFTQYRHVNNNEKKWLSFYRFFLSLSVELRLILLFYVLNMGEKKEMRVEHHVTHFFFGFLSFFFCVRSSGWTASLAVVSFFLLFFFLCSSRFSSFFFSFEIVEFTSESASCREWLVPHKALKSGKKKNQPPY